MLRPLDLSTPLGRAQDRQRRVLFTALASALAKGISLLTTFISVPLTLRYLGAERYGLWMTISSLTLVLSFADLGLGNGLLNAVAEANGKDDPTLARQYISSAFFLLAGLALCLGLVFMLLQGWVPWARVFNVSAPLAVTEAGPATSVFVACLLLNAPLGVVQRVQLGYQQGFANSLWQGLGNLLGLGGVVGAIHLRLGLPWLVFALSGLPLLGTLVQGVALFVWRYPHLRPHWSAASPASAGKILGLGFLFFVLQLAVALAFASDNLVAAQVLGPESVAEYSVAMRLFSVPTLILGMLFVPLWPAYGEAVTRGDLTWVRQTLGRSLLLAALVAGLPSIVFVMWGVPLIHWWAGASVTPSAWLLLGLALWTVLQALGNAVAMFLNGANVIRLQVICASLVAVGALAAKIALARWWGLPGIAWGAVLAYGLFAALPYLLVVPRLLATLPSASATRAGYG